MVAKEWKRVGDIIYQDKVYGFLGGNLDARGVN